MCNLKARLVSSFCSIQLCKSTTTATTHLQFCCEYDLLYRSSYKLICRNIQDKTYIWQITTTENLLFGSRNLFLLGIESSCIVLEKVPKEVLALWKAALQLQANARFWQHIPRRRILIPRYVVSATRKWTDLICQCQPPTTSSPPS